MTSDLTLNNKPFFHLPKASFPISRPEFKSFRIILIFWSIPLGHWALALFMCILYCLWNSDHLFTPTLIIFLVVYSFSHLIFFENILSDNSWSIPKCGFFYFLLTQNNVFLFVCKCVAYRISNAVYTFLNKIITWCLAIYSSLFGRVPELIRKRLESSVEVLWFFWFWVFFYPLQLAHGWYLLFYIL